MRLRERDGQERPAPSVRRCEGERIRPRTLALRHPRVREREDRVDRLAGYRPPRLPTETAPPKTNPSTTPSKPATLLPRMLSTPSAIFPSRSKTKVSAPKAEKVV